ncbi:MAG: penicillin-binding protein 2 [bacterium]|nr:penicillin-binding protein 2 [bacterium]
MKFRLLFLLTFFLLLYSALIFNTYKLQILKGDYFTARAASQSRLAGFMDSVRGSIFFTDRNGNPVPAAINKEYPVIYAVPKEIADPAMVAGKLAEVLGLNQPQLLISLSKPSDPFEPILKKATAAQVAAVRGENLPGIYIDQERFRFYPFAGLASQVLGFLAPTADNPAPEGKYGIEEKFNPELSGKHSESISLTIDPNIQTRAEEVLAGLISQFKAEGGTVIVQDPKTGKILAMGSQPSFDPNNYGDYKLNNFMNPAVQSIYEPGSIFKVITMSAGIDSGKITPDTTFTDTGSVTLDGRTIKNWDKKAHGKVTMTEVIEQSINTGAVFAARKTGRDTFYKYVLDFGFSDLAGIELPGEVAGDLNNLKTSFRDINFATASFGQGVAITPLALINAVSAIANQGILMKPYILGDTEPRAVRQVISPESARAVTGMMVSAVKKAQVAQIPKYDIAGKTGTAQIPDLIHGGYQEKYIHTYVGFAPAYNPSFTILLKLNKPNVTLAGMTVVPAFRELAEFILTYYNVPPDQLE